MKKLMAALVITTAALAFGACGGKAKKTTTPDNKAQAGSAGGATYGGTGSGSMVGGVSGGSGIGPAMGSGSSGGGAPADPCVGK